ncbi:MAG: DUF3301 domain-containing protein [Aestuariibacter sp.]
MNLTDILVLLVIIVIAIQFWRIRAITEFVQRYLSSYCEKLNLQLLSVARAKTGFVLHRGKLDWKTQFYFEFSSDGSNRYQGHIEVEGMQVKQIHLPPHTF